jgi:Sigma-70, region 4
MPYAISVLIRLDVEEDELSFVPAELEAVAEGIVQRIQKKRRAMRRSGQAASRVVSSRDSFAEIVQLFEAGRFIQAPLGVDKPITRADCMAEGENRERPCPFVACKYHTFLDVTRNGSLKLNFPDRQPWELKESCVLDLAEGGMTLEEVGEHLNLTRERVRQLEQRGLRKLERYAKHLREARGDAGDTPRVRLPLAVDRMR